MVKIVVKRIFSEFFGKEKSSETLSFKAFSVVEATGLEA